MGHVVLYLQNDRRCDLGRRCIPLCVFTQYSFIVIELSNSSRHGRTLAPVCYRIAVHDHLCRVVRERDGKRGLAG